MKKLALWYYKLNPDDYIKLSNFIIYLLLFLFPIFFVVSTFQNDTFYSIKIGEIIFKKGIDFKDHFCFIQNLNYSYPHLFFDLIIYIIYNKFNFLGLYIITIVFTIFNLVVIYRTNKYISNKYVSFIVTICNFFLLIPFFTARAQILTFLLFVLTFLFILKFLKCKKIIYGIILVIIPILISNIHLAVFPFYFVIYFPFFAEYFVALYFKKKKIKLEYYKLKIDYNENTKYLFIIFFISLFTGLLTPLKYIPYTYLINTLNGDSLNIISEHLPLVLIQNIGYFVYLIFIIFLLIFSKVKISLRELFFFLGFTLLSFMSQRQISFSIIFNGFIISNILNQIILRKQKCFYKFKKCFFLPIVFVLNFFLVLFIPDYINNINKLKNIDDTMYPTLLVKYLKENIDYRDKKIFNEYNFGSYLLFNDIPVFIDSRADLYMKEFNKFDGDDILTDYQNIYYNFDEISKKYQFNYYILYKDNKLNILIDKAYNYNKLYEDDYFILWEVK